MKRIAIVLVLAMVAVGCGEKRREVIMRKPSPADNAAAYLEGFRDGYLGVRPSSSRASLRRDPYQAGLRDGYITGKQDAMQSQ